MATSACLTDDEANLVLPTFAASVGAQPNADGMSPPIKVVETTCHRRVYQLNGIQLEVVKDGRKLSARSFLPGSRPTPEQRIQCFHRALDDIALLHSAEANTILQTYRDRFPKVWNDPEQGPGRFADCSTGKGPAYYESLATLLHETTHDLKNNGCLFVPSQTNPACFQIKDMRALPPSSVVFLATADGTGKQQQATRLENFQGVYQRLWRLDKQGFPRDMFDELNAYTVTADTYAAEIRAIGPSSLSHEGKPAEFYLPLLMIYTVRYLQALRALTPELYHSEFSPGTENRGTIDLLLQRAETAYRGWAAELEKAGVREPESERNLWDQYLALKAKLVGVASAGPARS